MYITNICIEGLHNVKRVKYDLSKTTYITGPNGSGKSTILNAIQLCLLGYIPGTAKNNKSIMEHANCPELNIQVNLHDEKTNEDYWVSRHFVKIKNTVTSDVVVHGLDLDELIKEYPLPVFDWNQFTNLSGNKQKQWFIDTLQANEERIDWKLELSKAVDDNVVYNKNIVDTYIDKIDKIHSDNVLDQVKAVNKMLKEEVSYSKAVLSEKENAINGLYEEYETSNVHDIDVARDKLRVEECELKKDDAERNYLSTFESYTQYTSLNNTIQNLSNKLLRYASIEDLDNKLDDMNNKVQECNDIIARCTDTKVHLKSQIEDKQDILSALKLQSVRYTNICENDGTCPVTGSMCNYINSEYKDECKTALLDIQSRMSSVNDDIQCLNKKKEQNNKEYIDTKSKIMQYKMSICDINKSKQQIKDITKDLESYKEKLHNMNCNVSESDVRDAYNLLDTYKKQYEEVQQKYHDNLELTHIHSVIDGMNTDRYKLQEKLDILNSWVKLTSEHGLQSTLSKSGFQNIEQQVSPVIAKFFGDSYSCKFNVSNTSNSFSFGITKKDTYIPYTMMSTGEKALFMYCIMYYLLESSNSQLRVILIDELLDHLDNKNLKKLQYMMYKDNVQIIVAGISEVPEETDDVTVISLNYI